MTDASAGGRSNRNRGAAAEREFVRWLRDELGIVTERNLKQYQQAQHGDVLFGDWCVEVKYHARLNVRDWWKQAVVSAKACNKRPALAYKVKNKGFRYVVPHSWCGLEWRYEYEFTMDVGPALFALIVRESL